MKHKLTAIVVHQPHNEVKIPHFMNSVAVAAAVAAAAMAIAKWGCKCMCNLQ